MLWSPIGNAEKVAIDSLLADAVVNNDLAAAQSYLQSGSADVNKATAYNQDVPLITTAIIKNSPEMVALLLEYKADPNISSKDSTPLLQAIEMQNPEIVQLLIEAGAKVNYDSSALTPPLLYSIEKFQPDHGLTIFRYLLNSNADINAKAADGTTALMLAANNNTDNQEYMCTIARELIKKGANRNLRDSNNKTALQYATDINFTTMMNILSVSPKNKVKTGLMVPVPVKIR